METQNTALKGGMVKCVIFLFCYIVFIKILPYFLHNPNYQCAMYIVMGIAGLLISLPELKEAGASWKAHPVRNVLLIIGGFIVMNIIDNLATIPYALLYSEQAGSINDSNLEVARQLAEPVLLVLGAGIMGPIVEETVFRSILMRKQGDFIPKAVVVIVSSVLFGMIHIEEEDGFKVYPSIIENVICECHDVLNCAVVGVRNEKYTQGMNPKAYITVRKDCSNEKTISAIKTICSKKLSEYQIPEEIEIIDEMPLTKVGKIDYVTLENMAAHKESPT